MEWWCVCDWNRRDFNAQIRHYAMGALVGELDIRFGSIDEYKAWRAQGILSSADVARIGEDVLVEGLIEPLSNRFGSAGEIQRGENWREGLQFEGINSRMRAVMLVIEDLARGLPRSKLRIYATEAISFFALRMRGIFPKFLGSEFTDDPAAKHELFPIACEDLTKLSFASESFDFVSTNEVLEHVPDMDKALSEVSRVLKFGGWHVGTHPFRFMSYETQVKARIEAGQVKFVGEPEYHGNPMSRDGSLVFQTPGWDILDRCKAAGFRVAEMRLVFSKRHGILADGGFGVFVLTAQK